MTYSQSEATEKVREFFLVYRRLLSEDGGSILSRRNMTMAAVARFAADMTIVDLLSDARWVVTLNGTGHCAVAGVDRTGENVLETCSAKERALRIAAARKMFATPCGLTARLLHRFEDGSDAEMESVSLPLLGNDGGQKVLTYGLLVRDIDAAHRDRPLLASIQMTSHSFVELGSGLPPDDAAA